jgi:hypothetical protein
MMPRGGSLTMALGMDAAGLAGMRPVLAG